MSAPTKAALRSMLVCAVFAVGACAPAAAPRPETAPQRHTPVQLALAQRDYEALLSAAAAGNHREVHRLAVEFCGRHAGTPHEPDVLAVGARAARAAGDEKNAAQLARMLLSRYPDDARAREAQQLLSSLGQPITPPSGGESVDPAREPAASSAEFRVGLLCPLTGEYAVLGQEMHEGARLAVEEHTRLHGPGVSLLASDTAGDGVRAVLAARDLIATQQATALVGDLLTPTTIAVGALCQERGVPLVSPTATQATIAELGDCVFQSNLTASLESRLLAEAAVRRLLRTRLSILHPDDEEGRAFADMFQHEVEQLGGRVVAREGFERTVTDFREILQRLRAAAPQALFLPCAPSQARLIAPQLPYYQLDVQLLGLSSWNSASLIGEVGDNLERAIFPSEIALMEQAQRDRFEQLWRSQRGSDQGVSPFALKTYFATALVLEAAAAGARTPRDVQRHLGAQFAARAHGQGADPLVSLRVVEAGVIAPFPVAAFPTPADSSSR